MTTTRPLPQAPEWPRRISGDEVRRVLGRPDPLTERKVIDRLDEYCELFIQQSPFCCIATMDAAGDADCSPRGDAPGFVRVLDPTTLVIPDRPGNRLADSFVNLLDNDGIGLLFFVPGYVEMLRVNGRGYPTDEPEVLAALEARGRVPTLATVVRVEEVYMHCGKALLRSELWDPEMQHLADALPHSSLISAAHIADTAVGAADIAADLADSYRSTL